MEPKCCGTLSVYVPSVQQRKVGNFGSIGDELISGWDQTGSNGANLSFPQAFGIDGPGRGEWIVGLINSIIYLTA